MGEIPPAGPSPAETTDYAIFEGLFRRALRVEPNGPMADELRQVGFDLRAPKGRYPTSVLKAALDVASRHRFPGLPLEQGHRELGRLFTSGFSETIVGRVMGSIIPFLGMELLMARMQKFTSMTTAGATVESIKEGEKKWRLRYHVRHWSPDFTAGALESGVAKVNMPVTVVVENRSETGFDLVVTALPPGGSGPA